MPTNADGLEIVEEAVPAVGRRNADGFEIVEPIAAPSPARAEFPTQWAPPFYPGREGEGGLYTPRGDQLPGNKHVSESPLELLTKGIPLRPFSLGLQMEAIGEKVPALRTPAAVVKGVENVATGAGQFMTSPAGLATLGLGAAPGAVRALASTAFAADMASHAPDAWQKYWEAAYAGDRPGQAQALTEGLGNLAMAGLAGSHGYREMHLELEPLARKLARAIEEAPGPRVGDLITEPMVREVAPALSGAAVYNADGFEIVERPGLTTERPPGTVERSSPPETITGPVPAAPDEGTASAMPAEREERPRAATPSRRTTEERPFDIIDAIEGHVGKINPKLIREANTDWRAIGAARNLFSASARTHADQAMNALQNEGLLHPDVTVDQFGEMLNQAAQARKDFRGARARYERSIVAEGNQQRQFTKRVLLGERPRKEAGNVEQVPVDQLIEGDKFQVQDHEFTVSKLEFDEDQNLTGIVVKDGPKFGVQTIEPGREFIHIDKGTLEPVAREDWPAPTQDFALAKPESVQEQNARLAQEEAQRSAAAQRRAVEEGAAQPLIGKQGDIGQGDLLGGGDLLSLREGPAGVESGHGELFPQTPEPAPEAGTLQGRELDRGDAGRKPGGGREGGEPASGPARRLVAPRGSPPELQAKLDWLTEEEPIVARNMAFFGETLASHKSLLRQFKYMQGQIDAIMEHGADSSEAIRDLIYGLLEQSKPLARQSSKYSNPPQAMVRDLAYLDGKVEQLSQIIYHRGEHGLVAGTQLEMWADQVLRGSGTHLGPDVLAAYVVKGVALLERGVRKFADWSQKMVAEHGADIRPHLRRIWEEAQREFTGMGSLNLGAGAGLPPARPILRAVQSAEAAADAARELSTAGPVPLTRSVLAGLQQLGGNLRATIASVAGESMPRTTRADRRAGELGVRYASSSLAAPHAAKAFADEVLAGLNVEPEAFGALLTEDNLRSVRAGFAAEGNLEAAGKVHTLVGAPGSPFHTEADLATYTARPGVQEALTRHRAAWERVVDPMYRQAMLIDDLLPLPTRGSVTQARINLFAVRPDMEGKPRRVIAGVAPNLMATFRRKSPFGRRATGASELYGTDYREIMQNTFARQLEIASKNAFDARLVESGHAYIGPPADPRPLAIGGEETVPFPLRRTVLVTRTEGGATRMAPAAANIYVRRSLAREYELAANLYRNRFSETLGRLTGGLNQAALAGLTDATVHVSNLATVLFTRPGNGARNPVGDILLSAFGRADIPAAIVRAVAKGFGEHSAQTGQLAEIGAMRGSYGASWNPLSRLIHWADKTTRLVLDDTFQGLAERGLVVNTETARREFVNQAGQYNKRLQGVLTHALRETGLGPFVTAGKTFNTLGVRNLFLAPGAKAATPAAAATLRAAIAARWVGSAVLIGALNYVLTKDKKGGGVMGRPGTPLGRIDTGRDNEAGRPLTVPALDLMGFGRALRVSGVRGAVESKRLGLDNAAALDASMRDLVNSWTAPALGPPARFAVGAASGYQPALGVPRQFPVVPPGQSQGASDMANAVYEANPVLATVRESGALRKVAPWMPYADQLPPKPTTDVIARQLPRFTLLPGKPAEMIERYPEIVQKAKSAAYIDDVIHRARTMGIEARSQYVSNSIVRLPAEEQGHAWQEMKRRRVYVLPAAAPTIP